MTFREIDNYSLSAFGNGCFFGGGIPKRVINTPGGQRAERIFTTDKVLDYSDAGVVEISETAAAELATLMGWIAPILHEQRAEEVIQAIKELAELDSRLTEQTERNTSLMKQLMQQLIQQQEEINTLSANVVMYEDYYSQANTPNSPIDPSE